MAIVKLFVQWYVYNYSHTKTISKVWLVLTTLCYCPNYGLFFKINLISHILSKIVFILSLKKIVFIYFSKKTMFLDISKWNKGSIRTWQIYLYVVKSHDFTKLFDNIYQSYTNTKIPKLIYWSFHMQYRYILFKFSNDKSKVYVYLYIEVYV